MVGNLDPLSPLITMFFLLCYTAVNASVLIQEWLRPPNWLGLGLGLGLGLA